MELLIFLAFFLALIWVFLLLCKKIDPSFTIEKLLDSFSNTKPTTQPVQTLSMRPAENLIYRDYKVDYQNFSNLVRDCLDQIGDKFDLIIPVNPAKIACSDIDSRVRIVGGLCIFSYEVRRKEPCFEGGMKQAPTASTQEIARTLIENLPNYMRDGYSYDGGIFVWDIEKNYIQIEIQGVNRKYLVSEDIII